MWKDIETSEDLLGYRFHAKLLKEIVLDKSMLPTSIGIFGNWGYGKSSLMLLLEKEINEEIAMHVAEGNTPRILQVRFNGWQYESYETTKYSLIQVLLDSVEKYLSDNRDVFEKLDILLKRINLLKLGVLLLKKYVWDKIPNAIKSNLPQADDLKECIGVDDITKFQNEFQNEHTSLFVTKFRTLLESIVEEAKFDSIIVYIDDLDRCSGEKMIECIEAIKLFLNVKNTAFVLGADERMVERAIKEHYPEIEQDKRQIYSPFSDYLEKLIQIPYRLPRLSLNEQYTYILFLLLKSKYPNFFNAVIKDYNDYKNKEPFGNYDAEKMRATLGENKIPDVEALIPIIPMMTRFLNGSPRQLKRFLNTFDLRMRMVQVANIREIEPTVLAKLMLLEYNFKYQRLFESLYGMQLLGDGIIDKIGEVEECARQKKKLNDKRWQEWEEDNLFLDWLSLSPSLSGVNLKEYFWIARDSLKNSVPVESLVSNVARRSYLTLRNKQSAIAKKKFLQEEIAKLEDEERQMVIMLLNHDFTKNPNDSKVLELLQADSEVRVLIQNESDCKSLFSHVDILKMEPAWGVILGKLKKNDFWNHFISPLKFGEKLQKMLNK
ncbi:KAP family P-loop NTPase fold protein [Segatella copri]|uniref:KAP P-loop protein n=1 Tax=Segatella copri TaxID=165179 RepID=A0AA90ZSV9_9BACT|nr:P-loop NTPase fold protein [Segatella copri]MQN83565.1 KAP P-loop protein [Segatella copri]